MRKYEQKKEDVNIASCQTQELSKQVASLLEMFHHLIRLFGEEAQSNRKNEEEIKELKIKVELLTRLSQCCSKCRADMRGKKDEKEY